MASRVASAQSSTIVGSPATNAETVVCTTGAVNLWIDSALVFLFWFVELTIGTSGVSLNMKLRRGTTTGGTLINVGQATTVVAANLYRFSGVYFDTPGAAAELQYSLTATVGSGAATSTVSDVMLIALVL